MKVLTAFHIGGVGGPQRSLPPVMEWLAARGELEFLVPSAGPTQDEYATLGSVSVLDYEPLTYARGPLQGVRLAWSLARDIRMFRRELRRRRPDLVIAVTTVLPALVVSARLEGVPAVVYAAELYGQDWKAAPLLRVWGRLLAGLTAALARGVVCCSAAVAHQFRHPASTPVVVAYPAIDPAYAAGDRARGRRRLGLGAEDACIAVVGSISRGRGQDVAIRALPSIRREFPSVRLLIVGDPHPRPVDLAFARELREQAAALGVQDAVTFAGYDRAGQGISAMADVYAAADVVVNAARFAEPFGRVAPEALMAGRPVVATRVGGVPEVVRDEIDALLVAPDDPEAIAGAVKRLLADPALAARLVDSGRSRVTARFGTKQGLVAWRQVLDPIIAT